ncbi:hypothetical protein V8E36_001308 [Tilletia maclaganii]
MNGLMLSSLWAGVASVLVTVGAWDPAHVRIELDVDERLALMRGPKHSVLAAQVATGCGYEQDWSRWKQHSSSC